MPLSTMKRTASAVWNGDLKDGKGTLSTQGGSPDQTPYSFSARFEHGQGTNNSSPPLTRAASPCSSSHFSQKQDSSPTN